MAEEAKQTQAAAATTVEAEGVLDQIIRVTRIGKDDWERDQSRRQIATLVDEVMKGQLRVSKDLEATISARITDIDRLLSDQLNVIMHAPEFQKLEGSWRGLHYLVTQSETSVMLKLRVLNVSKQELVKDLDRPEFDQSALWKWVYDVEYETFGGTPYGALIGDYEFGRNPRDIGLLEKISNVAACAHAPFLSAADPSLLGLESFTDLPNPKDLAKKMDTPDYAKWNSFRASEDSRYVALALPHMLMRLPYGPDTAPTEDFIFKEDVAGTGPSKYLWGNAAYAMATRLTASFAKYGWCSTIRGVENGGKVEGLPTHTFLTDAGEIAMTCPTEIAITEKRERESSDLGFMPPVHCNGTACTAFSAAQSCQKAMKYGTDAANAHARLSTQMQYLLAVSRFAHYLIVIIREQMGSNMTRRECEDFLNRWISMYVVGDPDARDELKAKFPLSEARVEVAEVPGKAGGYYRAVCFLRPHFQLEERTIALRLVADLPMPYRHQR